MAVPLTRKTAPPGGFWATAWILLLSGLTACSTTTSSRWSGPATESPVHSAPWTYGQTPGKQILTARYNIYTTIQDGSFHHSLAQLMEGAYEQYHGIAPDVPMTARPMECYIFANRTEWADFTARHTGPDAAVYLQINRGGYTYKDKFATYHLGDVGTYAVASHEGWHQYVARHYKGRLPPFLEEGLACMFENLIHDGRLPRWNLQRNPNRERGLHSAIEKRNLYPLKDLIAMHAGQVVNEPTGRIEAFYAQSWAFSMFMWEYNNGKYRPAMQKLLTDTARGQVFNPANPTSQGKPAWDPTSVKPILEHYLQSPIDDISREFEAYMATVARRVRQEDSAYP